MSEEEPCAYCGGYGVLFGHTADCNSDFCALAGGMDDCLGQIEECLEVDATQGIEAGTAETGTGSVHESPVPEGDAPYLPSTATQGGE